MAELACSPTARIPSILMPLSLVTMILKKPFVLRIAIARALVLYSNFTTLWANPFLLQSCSLIPTLATSGFKNIIVEIF